jgi:hypothetical protein
MLISLFGKEMTRCIAASILAAFVPFLASCAGGAYVDEYRLKEVSTTAAEGISSKQVEALRAGFVTICENHALTQYKPESARFEWLHYSRSFDKRKEDFSTRYLVARYLIENRKVTIEICTLIPDAEDHLAFKLEIEAMISGIVGSGYIEHMHWQRDGTLK